MSTLWGKAVHHCLVLCFQSAQSTIADMSWFQSHYCELSQSTDLHLSTTRLWSVPQMHDIVFETHKTLFQTLSIVQPPRVWYLDFSWILVSRMITVDFLTHFLPAYCI